MRRRFLPSTVPLLEGDEPLDLLSCLHDDHLSEVNDKTGITKSSNLSCLFQHTPWNPWAAAVGSCSSGVGFGSPLAEGRHRWPSQAHGCSGHQAVCRLCVQLPPRVGRIVRLLFFKVLCCPYSLSRAGRAKLTESRFMLNTAVSTLWVLVVLPCDFYP